MAELVLTYRCPVRNLTTPLPTFQVATIREIDFPITVAKCPACGEGHVLQKADVKQRSL